MTSTDNGIIDELARDPLYQLSTADQDQFHTRMLDWLITNHPEASHCLDMISEVFGRRCSNAAPTLITGQILERDCHGLDLFVGTDMGGPTLGVRNTLHSVPSRSRTEQIAEEFSDTGYYRPELLLLSLVRPAIPLPVPWRYVDYAELRVPLTEAARILRKDPERDFEAHLVDQYVRLLVKLLRLRDRYDLRSTEARPFLIGDPDREWLKKAHLLPLVEKYRISELAGLITETSRREVDVELSTRDGSLRNVVQGSSGHRFGWQYRHGKVHLSVELDDSVGGPWRGRRSEREQLVQQQFDDFFDLTASAVVDDDFDRDLAPYRGKAPWQGREPNVVYRDRLTHPNLKCHELVELCAALTMHVEHYAAAH